MTLILALDIAAMLTALVAAYLWWLASRSKMHRVEKHEVFDYHDLNRVIVCFNRTQILNSRAALATAVSAVFVALRYLMSAYGGA